MSLYHSPSYFWLNTLSGFKWKHRLSDKNILKIFFHRIMFYSLCRGSHVILLVHTQKQNKNIVRNHQWIFMYNLGSFKSIVSEKKIFVFLIGFNAKTLFWVCNKLEHTKKIIHLVELYPSNIQAIFAVTVSVVSDKNNLKDFSHRVVCYNIILAWQPSWISYIQKNPYF